MNQSSIFISYHHNDRDISREIVDVLEDLAGKGEGKPNLSAFLDTEGIRYGVPFQQIIDRELQDKDWLVVIFTGDQSVYCGYEIGTFTQQHAGLIGGKTPKKFVVTLYDVDEQKTPLPAILRPFQNTRVDTVQSGTPPGQVVLGKEELDEWFGSPLGRFLDEFCAYKGLYLPKHDPAGYAFNIASGAKRIAHAFANARNDDVVSETPALMAFDIFIRKGGKHLSSIPKDAIVSGTTLFFNVFGLQLPRLRERAPSTTWEDFGAALAQTGSQVPWLHKLESDVVLALQDRIPAGEDVTFRSAGNKIYRSVLVNHKLYGNGNRSFEFILVETMDRRFIGTHTSSMLLIGLILASRWRFTYFEKWSDTTTRLFGPDVPLVDFASACRQLVYNIEWIEHESAEFGLSNETDLINAFGDQRRARVQQFFKDWKSAKDRLEKALPTLDEEIREEARSGISDAIFTFLDRTRDQNAAFLRLAVTAYAEEIDRTLGPRPPD